MTTTTTTSKDDMIYTVTAEQREALLSSYRKDFEAALASVKGGIRATFNKEGMVLVRGLMDDNLLQRLCEEGQAVADAVKMASTFSSLKFSPVFTFTEDTSADEQEKKQENLGGPAFRDAALASAIPAFVARCLFSMDGDNNDDGVADTDDHNNPHTLRLLKDAFMAKGKEQKYCGWHVDDAGFWPTTAESNGVNVWIALDDMPAEFGGGLAVSPGSHTAEWREKAYQTIGSTKIFPPEGIKAGSEMFRKVYGKTCSMATLDPALNDLIESSKLEFDYQRGDCLFCTRWLFHRSVLVNEKGMENLPKDSSLKRYSIRYERGTARMPKGLSVENCVLLDSNNSGQTLDTVCEAGRPFYPQCWPLLSSSNLEQQEQEMKTLVTDTFPSLAAKRQKLLGEIMSTFTPNSMS